MLCLHTAGVAGSNPAAPTIYFCYFKGLQRSVMTVSRRTPSLAHSWHSEGAEIASIRRRNGRYHVQIRKNGYPSVTKIFIHLKTAKKWVSGTEADMERQRYCPIPETILLGGLLIRCSATFLLWKRTNTPHSWFRLGTGCGAGSGQFGSSFLCGCSSLFGGTRSTVLLPSCASWRLW